MYRLVTVTHEKTYYLTDKQNKYLPNRSSLAV